MKNDKSEVIYVGKALNLKKRVRSYFAGVKDVKTRVLVRHIKSIDHISTGSEFEALLLENNLIKKWQPRYNINLKDGKSYPVIRITADTFPRIFRTRRIIQDGSEYFGPYTPVSILDTYLELIEKLFPLRKCKGPLKKRQNPCLYYHIHRCSAPCVGKISKEGYAEKVSDIKRLLTGKSADLLRTLKVKMNNASQNLLFEQAAELRDAISAIQSVEKNQLVQDFDTIVRDYIASAEQDQFCTFAVFQMRTGKLLGKEMFGFEQYGDSSEAIHQFILQYYEDRPELPDKLYVPDLVDTELIHRFFLRRRDKKVEVIAPKRGKHLAILRMVRENGYEDIEQRKKRRDDSQSLLELKSALGIDVLPKRIEGFDISQLSGKYPVASMVSFFDGVPDKKNYRRFHLKTLEGAIDDYEAMREVIARRYQRVLNEKQALPDLILVDGGKGQVSAAKSILRALDLDAVPLIGLAKRNEEIFFPDRSQPQRLPESSDALKVLQRVRDESHRFATSFNRQQRKKSVSLTKLTEIQGVGETRGKKLITHFGSIQKIAGATSTEIAALLGIGEQRATQMLSDVKTKIS